MKKQFGQNFLRTPKHAIYLCQKLDIDSSSQVVEIGSGDGKISEIVVGTGAKFLGFEIDNDLIFVLNKKFNSNPQTAILFEDFLQTNLAETLANQNFNFDLPITFVGNLPFNISKKIIFKIQNFILDSNIQNAQFGFILQSEVAELYAAQTPHNTSIGTKLKLNFSVSLGKVIHSKDFSPVPKVNARFLFGKQINLNLSKQEIKKIQSFITLGFAHPRKKLSNNLKGYTNLDLSSEFLSKRPAELSLEDWILLYTRLT